MSKIIHFCHHKSGTVLFKNFLTLLSKELGDNNLFTLDRDCDRVTDYSLFSKKWRANIDMSVFNFVKGIKQDSIINFSKFPEIDSKLISHSVRDPRDMLISGYFYHKKCDEDLEPWITESQNEEGHPRYWLREKSAEANDIYDEIIKKHLAPHAGRKKQDVLNKLNKNNGLIYEMFVLMHETFKRMYYWKESKTKAINEGLLTEQNIKEIKYEQIMENFDSSIIELLDFYKIEHRRDDLINKARDYDPSTWSKSQVKEDRHVNFKYKKDRWKDHFTDEVTYLFKLFYGDLIVDLGYEKDYNW